MKSLAAAAALSLSLIGAAPAAATQFTGLYAFGDSLSDVGNVFIATGGAIPGAPYYSGRYSNGPNWLDNLSAYYGLGPVTPALAGGNDYAFGGAVTGSSVPAPPAVVPNIGQQVGAFTLKTGGVAPSTALYTVWIGANDIFNALDGIVGGTLAIPAAITDLQNAAKDAAAAIATLAGEGAKSFVVPLVPDLAATPVVSGFPPLAPVATALSLAYNATLVAAIAADTVGDALDLHFVDTFALINQVVADPAGFGLTNASDRCYIGPLTGGGTVCATPSTYLFWDGEHPTAAGHLLVAQFAEQAIPEPSAMVAMAAALLGLIGVRRRKAEHGASAD